MEAARLLANEGIGVRVIDVYRFKPVDMAALHQTLSDVHAVVTLEENSPVGALGSLISEIIGRSGSHHAFHSLSLEDDPLMGSASRKWAEDCFGLSLENVLSTLRHMASTKASS